MARERWTNDGRGRGRRRGDGPIGSPAGERPRPRVARRDRRDDGAVEARPRGASTTTPRPPHTPQTATFTRTAQPAREQDSNSNTNNGRRRHNHNNGPICLVHLKIARDAPRLLGFAIYVWTIPAQVVQIYIAISASAAHLGASSGCSAQSRVPRAGLYRPHRSSGRMAGACGVRGTWWRSCGDGGAFMAGVSSFGCGGPGWSSSSNADATSRQPPAEEPHSSQRSNNARIRASPRGALRAGSRTSGRKVPAAPAPSVRGATKSLAPGSR